VGLALHLEVLLLSLRRRLREALRRGSLVGRGIDLGMGAGLFRRAGRGQWVWPAPAMRWVGWRWIFEASWAKDQARRGWQPVSTEWAWVRAKI
jgi:hypothetical protein